MARSKQYIMFAIILEHACWRSVVGRIVEVDLLGCFDWLEMLRQAAFGITQAPFKPQLEIISAADLQQC